MLKEHNIPFEGFLECLCHLCQLKSLPTTQEIAERYGEAGGDAGAFVLDLKASDEQAYAEFLRSAERHIEWGETPPAGFEPAEVRLHHLVTLIVATVERGGKHGSQGAGDGELSEQEVDAWMTANKISAVQ